MNVVEQFFYEQAKQIGLRRIAALALVDRTTDEAHKRKLRQYVDRLKELTRALRLMIRTKMTAPMLRLL
jgi:hypothetical protein